MVDSGEMVARRARTEAAAVPRLTLPAHGLTRYLRPRLEVSRGALRWKVPRALLGVVPLGVRRVVVPLRDVRSIQVGKAVRPLDLSAGLALIFVPPLLGFGWASLPLAIGGAWIGLVSFGMRVRVTTRTGGAHRAFVCFGHQIDADLYAEAVNDLIGR